MIPRWYSDCHQDAYNAYNKSDGSMNALISSLVTSDAFHYRKVKRNGEGK